MKEDYLDRYEDEGSFQKHRKSFDYLRIVIVTILLIAGGYFMYQYVVAPFGYIYKISSLVQIIITSGLVFVCIVINIFLSRKIERSEVDFDIGMGSPKKPYEKHNPELSLKIINEMFMDLELQIKNNNVEGARRLLLSISDELENVTPEKRKEIVVKCAVNEKKIGEIKKRIEAGKGSVENA